MNAQRGATLLVALIMLILLTLAAITSFNLSRSNLVIVGNQQHRSEAVASAKSALEEVVSHTYFSDTPATPLGTTNIKTYDVNGDGTPDVTVTVGQTGSTANPPPCIKSYQVLPVDPNDPSQLGCASGVQQQFGVEGSATWGAQCADIVWEVTAAAEDSLTQASTVVAQGIRVREDANKTVNTANYCP